MTPSPERPQCPKCGSENVRNFDVVPIGYDVLAISPDGTFNIDASTTPVIVTDDGRFDELRCRDCDYASSTIDDFYPWPSERARAEALIGCEVMVPDGYRMLVEQVLERDGKILVRGVDSNRAAGYVARPHEVLVLNRG